MAFRLGNVAFDRVLDVWGEDSTGKMLYYSNNVNSININVTADKKEYTDSKGSVFYTTYTGKKGDVSITNAMFNTTFAAIAAATDINYAGGTFPRGLTVAGTKTTGQEIDIPNAVSGSVKVTEVTSNGAMITELVLDSGETASTGKFVVTGAGTDNAKLKLPAVADESHNYVIRYNRTVAADKGIEIINSADKYPKQNALYIRALAIDPCDGLKLALIEMPKFVPSPETTIAISNDQETMDFTGDMNADYCGKEKSLYRIYIVDGDEDDEDFGEIEDAVNNG